MSKKHLNEIVRYTEYIPDIDCGRGFLRRHFPKAVDGLIQFSAKSGFAGDIAWSYVNVSNYWHTHVGHVKDPSCSVSCISGLVSNGTEMRRSKVTWKVNGPYRGVFEGKPVWPLLDEFGLQPGTDEMCFVHKRIIAEVAGRLD